MESKPRVLIFANGTKDGGGSGFEALVFSQRKGLLKADIVGVVSLHVHGGVKRIADLYGVPFIHFPGNWDKDKYQKVIEGNGFPWVALSGWMKIIEGHDPRKAFNIHPARLSFGGVGLYGIRVHRAVIEAYKNGQIKDTAITMHFATEEPDKGPVIFEYPLPLYPSDTPEILQERVKSYEHLWQPVITNLVVNGKISWDGRNPKSLIVPKGYRYLPKK
jgi:folate-dependent phosphoribosylglycinamide formyltransferase PurN